MMHVALYFVSGCAIGYRYCLVSTDSKVIAFLLDQLYFKALLPSANNHIRTHVHGFASWLYRMKVCYKCMSREGMKRIADIEKGLAYLLFWYLQFTGDFSELTPPSLL